MITAFGYGINMRDVKLKKDAAKFVIENYGDNELRSDFRDFCCDGGLDPDDAVVRVEAAKEFAKEYEEPLYCEHGFNALLTHCINCRENDKVDIFSSNKFYIYYTAHIPENEEEKAASLSIEDIKAKLSMYLKPIVDGELTFEHIAIYD